MTSIDWKAEVDEIKARLAAFEAAATEAHIPRLVVEELKSAVDHCRTTLWATLLATQSGSYQGTSVIVEARITRVQEMCRRIEEDVASGRIWKETAGVASCHAVLGDTQRSLRSLFEN